MEGRHASRFNYFWLKASVGPRLARKRPARTTWSCSRLQCNIASERVTTMRSFATSSSFSAIDIPEDSSISPGGLRPVRWAHNAHRERLEKRPTLIRICIWFLKCVWYFFGTRASDHFQSPWRHDDVSRHSGSICETLGSYNKAVQHHLLRASFVLSPEALIENLQRNMDS